MPSLRSYLGGLERPAFGAIGSSARDASSECRINVVSSCGSLFFRYVRVFVRYVHLPFTLRPRPRVVPASSSRSSFLINRFPAHASSGFRGSAPGLSPSCAALRGSFASYRASSSVCSGVRADHLHHLVEERGVQRVQLQTQIRVLWRRRSAKRFDIRSTRLRAPPPLPRALARRVSTAPPSSSLRCAPARRGSPPTQRRLRRLRLRLRERPAPLGVIDPPVARDLAAALAAAAAPELRWPRASASLQHVSVCSASLTRLRLTISSCILAFSPPRRRARRMPLAAAARRPGASPPTPTAASPQPS